MSGIRQKASGICQHSKEIPKKSQVGQRCHLFDHSCFMITCVMTIPALDEVFKVQTLTFTQLLIVYGLALVNLPIIQLMKKIKLMFRKNK